MAIEFKDVTSHPRGAEDRTPRTWTANIGCVRLTVTRHIYYGPDEWIARSHPNIIDEELLQSKSIDEAKNEAVKLLARRCNEIVMACI